MISFFEIPVLDLGRAERFYADLFHLGFERAGIDGLEMSMFLPGPDDHATPIHGALVKGETYVPSLDGTRVYFRVSDLRETLERARRLGVTVLYPHTEIGEHGFVAEVRDSEGNRIALHQPRR